MGISNNLETYRSANSTQRALKSVNNSLGRSNGWRLDDRFQFQVWLRIKMHFESKNSERRHPTNPRIRYSLYRLLIMPSEPLKGLTHSLLNGWIEFLSFNVLERLSPRAPNRRSTRLFLFLSPSAASDADAASPPNLARTEQPIL